MKRFLFLIPILIIAMGCANQQAAVNLGKAQASLAGFGANMQTAHDVDEAQRAELEDRILYIEIAQKAAAGGDAVGIATGALLKKAAFVADRAHRDAAFQGTFQDFTHGVALVQSVLLYHQTGVNLDQIDLESIGELIGIAIVARNRPPPAPEPAPLPTP